MSDPDFESFYLEVINRGFESSYVEAIDPGFEFCLRAIDPVFMGPDLTLWILSSHDHKFCLALRTIDVGFRFRFHTPRRWSRRRSRQDGHGLLMLLN